MSLRGDDINHPFLAEYSNDNYSLYFDQLLVSIEQRNFSNVVWKFHYSLAVQMQS